MLLIPLPSTSPPIQSRRSVVVQQEQYNTYKIMSSRRSRASGFTEDEIHSLILKLQSLLPDSASRNRRVQASKILEETCNYIRKLNRDADDLSDRLSQLLASVDINAVDTETIRSLFQQ